MDIYQYLLTRLPTAVLERAYLIPYAGALVSGLIVGIFAWRSIGRMRERNRVSKFGRTKQELAYRERVFDTPQLHATLLDRQTVAFSFFALLSAIAAYFVDVAPWNGHQIGPLSTAEIAALAALFFGAVACVVLLYKWLWSGSFKEFGKYKLRMEAKLERLQSGSLSKRSAQLSPDAAQRDADEEAASEAPNESNTDKSAAFLTQRENFKFVLSKDVDDGKGVRPWRIGTVTRIGPAGYGFITERLLPKDGGMITSSGPQHYFNYTNVCNEALPEVGDEAFFVTSKNRDRNRGPAPPAYLICLRNKACRGIVRAKISKKVYYVEIADGTENFASVLGLLDTRLIAEAKVLAEGQPVEGIVTHNNRGVILKELKHV